MNAQLALKIEQCPSLPSLPATALAVLEMARDPDADLPALAKLVSRDPALSGKILRTVNSSFYARPQPVAKVSQAVALLGMQSVRTLVLGFSLTNNLNGAKQKGFDHQRYWKRSAYAATAARLIAPRAGVLQVEEAFLASLLQDVGMLALATVLGEEYGKLHRTGGEAGGAALGHAELLAAESAALGLTHADAGGILAKSWRLPPVLAVPVERHHSPEGVEDDALRRVAQVVSLAGLCADVFTDDRAKAAIDDARRSCAATLELDEAAADALLKEVGEQVGVVAALFEIPADTSADYETILRRANEALVEINLEAQRQSEQKLRHLDELQEANEALKQRAEVDALTGLGNRGAFDRFLAAALHVGRVEGTPVGLLMLDVDHFKRVNDEHGHAAGDDVLRYLGRLLKGACRPSDLPARYGGEELVIVWPGMTRAMATQRAEQIRRALEARPVKAGGKSLAITASFGVAAFERGVPLDTPARLMLAADRAVYAAKQGGRNRVKVFTLPGSPTVQPATPAA